MAKQLTEEAVNDVLSQIRDSSTPLAASAIAGDSEVVLLAIRELRRRGLITGKYLDDSTRPGDAYGRFLYDAARLEAV
ncbi:MAG: hypothetical protein AB1459_16545 [Pseudomonadota bacterium]